MTNYKILEETTGEYIREGEHVWFLTPDQKMATYFYDLKDITETLNKLKQQFPSATFKVIDAPNPTP